MLCQYRLLSVWPAVWAVTFCLLRPVCCLFPTLLRPAVYHCFLPAEFSSFFPALFICKLLLRSITDLRSNDPEPKIPTAWKQLCYVELWSTEEQWIQLCYVKLRPGELEQERQLHYQLNNAEQWLIMNGLESHQLREPWRQLYDVDW